MVCCSRPPRARPRLHKLANTSPRTTLHDPGEGCREVTVKFYQEVLGMSSLPHFRERKGCFQSLLPRIPGKAGAILPMAREPLTEKVYWS